MTRPRVEICDATLSDGARGVGCAMTRTQRTELLHQLARLPFAAIELGWPACDETAAWLAEAAAIELAAMPVVALRPGDVGATLRATEAFAAIRFHLHDRRATLDELDRAIAELHDAGRDDIGILVGDEERIPALRDLGVTRIVLDDRAGALTPPELAAIAPDLDGVRCRGDLGLATANTLAAIAAGVHEVHGTVGGIGERAGLCALDEVMTVLAYKPEIYGATISTPHRPAAMLRAPAEPGLAISTPHRPAAMLRAPAEPRLAIQVELRTLADVARRIARVLGRRLPITKPFLGDGVFATSLERHELYVRPEDFGRRRKPTPARVLRDALPGVHHDDLADFERWLLGRGVEVRPDDVVACYEQYQRESSGRDEVTVPARRSALVIE